MFIGVSMRKPGTDQLYSNCLYVLYVRLGHRGKFWWNILVIIINIISVIYSSLVKICGKLKEEFLNNET